MQERQSQMQHWLMGFNEYKASNFVLHIYLFLDCLHRNNLGTDLKNLLDL